MRFIEAQLVMLNPIIPHFSQYCWEEYVEPVLQSSKGYVKIEKNISKQTWPTVSSEFDQKVDDKLQFMKDVKSTIRLGFEAAKSGGKKGKKGKAQPKEEAKVIEKCYIFVANEYPES